MASLEEEILKQLGFRGQGGIPADFGEGTTTGIPDLPPQAPPPAKSPIQALAQSKPKAPAESSGFQDFLRAVFVPPSARAEAKNRTRVKELSKPGLAKAFGVSQEVFDVIKGLPPEQRAKALETLGTRAPGAGNKVVGAGGSLVDSSGKSIFTAPFKPGAVKMGSITTPDGKRRFGNINDPAIVAAANKNGAALAPLKTAKSNVQLLTNGKQVRSFDFDKPEDVAAANAEKFLNTVGTRGEGGKESTKFFNATIRDKNDEIVSEHFVNGDQLNALMKTVRTKDGETIDALLRTGETKAETLQAQSQHDFGDRVNNIDRLATSASSILKVLQEAPAASTFVGGAAEFTSSLAAGVAGILGLTSNEVRTFEPTKGQVQKLAKQSAELKSATLELAFAIAEVNGQTGRGLSDRDFQIALDIVGANGDPTVVAGTLGALLNRTTTNARKTRKNKSLSLNAVQGDVLNRTETLAKKFTESAKAGLAVSTGGNKPRFKGRTFTKGQGGAATRVK